ncbi:MAG: prepilin-type N-terminal cleavage/methylation domain-containing protein [Planctomycetota bacterium]|jgi:prepilin-type N-terminal cleavage/methylation domain-containing protein
MNLIKPKPNAGFTLVEMLLSMAILAMIMAAVGVAFNASAVNYSQNEAMFKAMNTARQALLRITTEIRTAQSVALIGAGAGNDPDNQQCSMITSDSRNITYRYDSSNNTLYLDDNIASASYVMCDNVTAITFNRATVPEDAGAIRSVRISMTVSVDDLLQTLATGAVVRRNL